MRFACILTLSIFGGLLLAGARPEHPAESALSPDEIMRRAVERAQSTDGEHARPDYLYTKFTITEELDEKGRLKERKEKRYQGFFHAGLSYLKLMKVEGQNLSASQLKKRQEQELADRQKLTQAKFSKGGDHRENFLSSDLVARYSFALAGSEQINNRTAYRLVFQPKSHDLPVRQVTDRLLNQIAGTVWIDADEFEIAKAEIHLDSEVALWHGVLASLKRFTFSLERTRVDDGVWFNRASSGEFEGRKLMDALRIRTRSESSNFRKVSALKQDDL
jgi:hypothetical protein